MDNDGYHGLSVYRIIREKNKDGWLFYSFLPLIKQIP